MAVAVLGGLTVALLRGNGSLGSNAPEPPDTGKRGPAPKDEDTPRRSPPPRDFFGIVSEDVFAGDPDYRRRNLDRQVATGIGLVRQPFRWSQIEKAPGEYDFVYYDEYVAALAERGMELLPTLFEPPPFRSSAPARGRKRGTYPPKRFSDMGDFAAAVARRYGPRGTLWSDRPGLRRKPIRAWQVWNEPNLPAYWPTGPDPKEYARLLEQTSEAIRAVDPEAEIVTAGLPESRLGIPFADFVSGMYEAGADAAFDTLAIHSFAEDERGVLASVGGARDLLERFDEEAKIWVTELGWASDGPKSAFTVGFDGQAERIRRSLAALAERREDLGIRGVVYFNWKDAEPYPGGTDFWGLHTGLLDIDGRPKPALAAFRATVRAVREPGRPPR